MKRFRLVSFGLAMALGAFGWMGQREAVAGSTSTTFTVTTNVTANCTIAASGISFTGYDPVVTYHSASSNLPATGTLTVQCTNGTAATVGLDEGLHKDASSTPAVPVRQMLNGASLLRYTLWQDNTHTTVWGNQVGAYEAYNSTTGLSSSTLTIYAQLPGGQDAIAGMYSDTVTATINF